MAASPKSWSRYPPAPSVARIPTYAWISSGISSTRICTRSNTPFRLNRIGQLVDLDGVVKWERDKARTLGIVWRFRSGLECASHYGAGGGSTQFAAEDARNDDNWIAVRCVILRGGVAQDPKLRRGVSTTSAAQPPSARHPDRPTKVVRVGWIERYLAAFIPRFA